jgi:non-specific serine/threonine protein kinase
MGEVYRAHDVTLHRDVALKFLPATLALDADRAARLRREARTLASLNHSNVATIHGLDEHDGVPFIVMEYVRGETLSRRLPMDRWRPRASSASLWTLPMRSTRLISSASIHRDIKSSNIMVTETGRAKVLDFGLSSRETVQPVSSEAALDASDSRTVGGTIRYMSPEQARGEPLDHRSDLFSLGVVLYELATGELPFQGETPAEIVDGILHRDPWPIRSITPDVSDELWSDDCEVPRKGPRPALSDLR